MILNSKLTSNVVLARLIFGFALGIVIIIAIVALWIMGRPIKPANLMVTNQTSNSASVIFTTDRPAHAVVEIEISKDRYHLSDEESSKVPPQNLHYISLYGLKPETKYQYRILLNNRKTNDVYEFTTTKVPENLLVPDPVYGKIVKQQDEKARDVIVLYNKIKGETKSQTLSTFVKNDSYTFDSGNVLNANLDSFFDSKDFEQEIKVLFWEGSLKTQTIQAKPDEDQPVKDVVLFKSAETENITQTDVEVQAEEKYEGVTIDNNCCNVDTWSGRPGNGCQSHDDWVRGYNACVFDNQCGKCTLKNNNNNQNQNNTVSGCFRLEGDVEKVSDGKFNVSIRFVSEGGDGDVKLEKNGVHLAGWNAWNKGQKSTFTYSSEWTGSPINVSSGQTIDVSYTGTVANTAACPDIRKTLTCSFNYSNGICGGTLQSNNSQNQNTNQGSGSGDCNAGNGLIIPNNSYSCFSTTSYIKCVNGTYSQTEKGICSSCRGTSANLSEICQNANTSQQNGSGSSSDAGKSPADSTTTGELKCGDTDTTNNCADKLGETCDNKLDEACKIVDAISNCAYGLKCSGGKCVTDGEICTGNNQTPKCARIEAACEDNEHIIVNLEVGKTQTYTCADGSQITYECRIAGSEPVKVSIPDTGNMVDYCALTKLDCSEDISVKMKVGDTQTFTCASGDKVSYKCEAKDSPARLTQLEIIKDTEVKQEDESSIVSADNEFHFNQKTVKLYSCPKVESEVVGEIKGADIQSYGVGIILYISADKSMYLISVDGRKGWIRSSQIREDLGNIKRVASSDCFDTNGDVIIPLGVFPEIPYTGTGTGMYEYISANPNIVVASEEKILEPGKYTVEGTNVTTKEFEIVSQGVVEYFQDLNNDGRRQSDEPLYEGDIASLNIKFNKVAESISYPLNMGWNLVSFPSLLRGNQTSDIEKASQLLTNLNAQGLNATHVITFRSGKFITFSQRNTQEGKAIVYGEDFNIMPGEGYFIKVYMPGTAVLNGQKVSDRLEIAVENGWNLVGIYNANKLSYKSFDILKQFNTSGIQVDILSRWENGIYGNVILQNGREYGNDFNIYQDRGYFIRVNNKGAGKFAPN